MNSDPDRRDESDFYSVSAAQASQLVQDLHDRGVATLRGAISPSWLAAAREEIQAYVGRHGPGDHDLFDHEDWESGNPQIGRKP